MRLLALITSLVLLPGVVLAAGGDRTAAGRCMTCHKEKTPGLYRQWYVSPHAAHDVTCLDCHAAEPGDADAFDHEGAKVATLVTPADCGRCHEAERDQVERSYHAEAGKILESKDAYLAHAAGGEPIAIAGCESCHGTKVRIDPTSPNKLSRKSWPNSGIGRLNPDGSKGACTACHTRHSFSKAQARRPEACSKCHLGPDHPQKEVYEESKHGNAFYTHVEDMNLKSDRWVVGVDYYEAPTCASCHLSATRSQKVTHDVGDRISWTLRPPVSKTKKEWQKKRDNMKDVCSACHGPRFIDGHYLQFDGVVRLYNDKFAKPAGELMGLIKKKGLLKNKSAFSNKLEWVYWEVWHHEGRRARHGASMMGPDYAWWHGIYDVAQHFYFKFLPLVRKLNDPEVNAALKRLIDDDPMHDWLKRPTGEIKEAIRAGELQKLYENLYSPE